MLDYGTDDGMRWLSGPDVVEFIVLDDGRPITCRVSQKCLEHNCECSSTAAGLLGAAKDNFDHITNRGRGSLGRAVLGGPTSPA